MITSYVLVKWQNYIKEIQIRFYYVFFSFLFTWLCSYFFCEQLIYLCTWPVFANTGTPVVLIFMELTEAFYIHIKTCTLVSLFLTVPIILYQFWLFIKPGLYKFEKERFILFSCFFFLFSSPITIYFIYYIILPAACKFFLSFDLMSNSHSPNSSNFKYSGVFDVDLWSSVASNNGWNAGWHIGTNLRAINYLSFISKLFFWCYSFLQIPFFIFLFLYFGWFTEEALAKKRKLAYLFTLSIGVFFISDALSQVLACSLFLFFYELAIFVSLFIRRLKLISVTIF